MKREFSEKCVQKIIVNIIVYLKTPILVKCQQSDSVEDQLTEKYSRNGHSEENIDLGRVCVVE